MLTVSWLELLTDGVLPVVHTPEPDPTPHLNCTRLTLEKLLPLTVKVCEAPSAVIAVGLTLVTEGTGIVAVTVTDCVPEEQSEVLVWLEDRHTRTKIVSSTVPGFMLTVSWLELVTDGVLPVVHTPEPDPTPHLNCTRLMLWKLLPLTVSVCEAPSAVIDVGLTLLTEGTGIVAVTVTDCVPEEQSEVLV
jgi:hypothetical protein